MIEQSKQKAIASNEEGVRLLQAGDYEGALAAFTAAIDVDREFEVAYRNRARALRHLGRSREAEADLTESESRRDAGDLQKLRRQGLSPLNRGLAGTLNLVLGFGIGYWVAGRRISFVIVALLWLGIVLFFAIDAAKDPLCLRVDDGSFFGGEVGKDVCINYGMSTIWSCGDCVYPSISARIRTALFEAGLPLFALHLTVGILTALHIWLGGLLAWLFGLILKIAHRGEPRLPDTHDAGYRRTKWSWVERSLLGLSLGVWTVIWGWVWAELKLLA